MQVESWIRTSAAALLVLVAGCRQRSTSTLPAVGEIPQDWILDYTPDSLQFRHAESFKLRNDFGCWESNGERWPGPGWRDFCIRRTVEPTDYRLDPEPLRNDVSDRHSSESWQLDTVELRGRSAIVERARISGGVEGARRERRLYVAFKVATNQWVELHGRTGDDAGYAELLTVASTIELP